MRERDGYEQFSGTAIKESKPVTTINAKSNFRRTLKSIGSVFAGFVAVAVLSTGADLLMHATGIYPPWGKPVDDSQLALATTYRSIFAVAGGYLSALLAPGKPMQHAIALGILGFLVALLGLVLTWNGGPEFGRKWYPITLVVTAIPLSWLGGKLYAKRLKN
jgi:hypothetical protein